MAGDTELRAPRFVSRHPSAFTLIELLVVITILGILAGLAVPALKELGKSNANLGASQQLLADLGHARQLAIADHTTVYMVFVPTNFWTGLPFSTGLTNLADKQMTGYTFVSLASVGDQPGRHTPHYLAPWLNLPAGTFIVHQKFDGTVFSASQWLQDYNPKYSVTNFSYFSVPFPTETSAWTNLPCVAFNYLGQLTLNGQDLAGRDEYIPLARGSVAPAVDQNKALLLSPPTVEEIPPGNSTGISYNIIHIDALTGRAVLEFFKLK